MISPEEIFKQAHAELDRVVRERGFTPSEIEAAHATLDHQLLTNPILQAVDSAASTEHLEYGARLQAWREKIGDSSEVVKPLTEGSNGRFNELSVEDIRFFAALEIDVLTEAPPDRREWKPRAQEF